MSAKERNKGRKGQHIFTRMLQDRDWTVSNRGPGVKGEDIIATEDGVLLWCIEVKMTKIISTTHREQAIKQAESKKLHWMLASHIEGTNCWLVQRQGHKPAIWSSKTTRNPVTCKIEGDEW